MKPATQPPPESVFEGLDLSPTGGGFRSNRDGSVLVGLVGFVGSTVCMDKPNSKQYVVSIIVSTKD